MSRDYRDGVIEEYADVIATLRERELALGHQHRLERAMLLDRIDALARELAMIDPRSAVHRAHAVTHREAA